MAVPIEDASNLIVGKSSGESDDNEPRDPKRSSDSPSHEASSQSHEDEQDILPRWIGKMEEKKGSRRQ